MRFAAISLLCLSLALSLPSEFAGDPDEGNFSTAATSASEGELQVEVSIKQTVSTSGSEGTAYNLGTSSVSQGGVVEVVEGPVGGFRVPGWQVRCKIGTGTAGAT
ncbi:MAG: hypothetical protein E6943_04035, partial [Actinomyces sp.]|nr:hypothetical protein [Actinomyces sp.]MDU2985066.1 hypothetical protein [Actinomyces sp.]MDU5964484.1 hypothetical protein [Actinomyces sp.]